MRNLIIKNRWVINDNLSFTQKKQQQDALYTASEELYILQEQVLNLLKKIEHLKSEGVMLSQPFKVLKEAFADKF